MVSGALFVGGSLVYVVSQLTASGIDVYSTDGETFQIPTAEEINGPINLLLIGSDTRQGQVQLPMDRLEQSLRM